MRMKGGEGLPEFMQMRYDIRFKPGSLDVPSMKQAQCGEV